MLYYHCDVFSDGPLTGNGLSVMICDRLPDEALMQSIAKELKQFETIFLEESCPRHYNARIFTVSEELLFAGHPVLGAAAAVMDSYNNDCPDCEVMFHLRDKDVPVRVESSDISGSYRCCMDQGIPRVLSSVDRVAAAPVLESLHISPDDLDGRFPIEVCTTGLPYLIVPLIRNIGDARVCSDSVGVLLNRFGAKFPYVLDTENIEGRTWDNTGAEDVATGSAAGPAGDYLIRHGSFSLDQTITISQGRFVGRPSRITVRRGNLGQMLVSGDVQILGRGTFSV